MIRRTPGRLLDLSLPSPVPDYGLHLGGESLLLGLAHTLPPLCGSSSSRSLDPPLHLPTSGRIFQFLSKRINLPLPSWCSPSLPRLRARAGRAQSQDIPRCSLFPPSPTSHSPPKGKDVYLCKYFLGLQNHNNGIPPKYLLEDLKEGGIKKFRTTFQEQDASRLISHLQDILWNN